MRISDWSSDVCSSDLRGSRSGIDRLKPLREPARAPFPIERLIEFARVVRALPVAFALLGPSRYSDAHMHRSHILPLAHKFRDVMLGIRSEERRVGKECVSTCSLRGSQNH